jgi:hypothetical protein
MRLRRAVSEIPAKISVPPELPFNKNRSLPTHSESTLLQQLIPLHFISFSSNVYRKPGEGPPRPSPKVLQLVTTRLPARRTNTNTRNPNPFYALLHNSMDAPIDGGHAPSQWDSQSWLSPAVFRVTGRGTRATGHGPLGPPVPLRRNPQSARITVVTPLRHPGNISAPGGV